MSDSNATLLPCPFCGDEAHISMSSDGYGVECWNRRCIDMQLEEIPTEAEAIAAWNTRAERTCGFTNCDSGEMEIDVYALSCGHVAYYPCVLDVPPAYCPECGAKVVGE